MSNRPTALVTGAAGFIGTAVCRRLASEGHDVLGIDINPDAVGAVQEAGAAFRTCDTTDPAAVGEALAGRELVVHAAAIVSDWGSMEHFIDVNVRGTRNILDQARAHGVAAVVHVSSVAAWGYDYVNPPGDRRWTARQGVPYVDTKAASDDLALRRGAAVVRPGDVYGPGSTPWSVRPLEALKSGRFRLPGRGEGLMAPVFIDDLVDLILLAATDPRARGTAVTGFGGDTVTAAEFFDHYARMLGMERTPTAPRPLALLGALAMEAGARLSGNPPQVSRNAMVFIDRQAGYDTNEARRLLGWSPKVELDEGMRRTGQWFRQVGLLPESPGS